MKPKFFGLFVDSFIQLKSIALSLEIVSSPYLILFTLYFSRESEEHTKVPEVVNEHEEYAPLPLKRATAVVPVATTSRVYRGFVMPIPTLPPLK